MSLFYKFHCGCIGIPLEAGSAVVLVPCDGDRDLAWFKRDVDDASPLRPLETREPLSEADAAELHQRIQRALIDAERYQAIRFALQLPRE